MFHKLLGSIGSKLLCNDLENAIFRHFEKIDYYYFLFDTQGVDIYFYTKQNV